MFFRIKQENTHLLQWFSLKNIKLAIYFTSSSQNNTLSNVSYIYGIDLRYRLVQT